MTTTTTEDKKPTEEQVKEANVAEEARWEGDFKEEDLKIPYKREAQDEKIQEDGAKDDTEPKDALIVDDEYQDPTPVVTTKDPGVYEPADYSFEVTDKDGKTIKLSTPEQANRFAEDDDNFKTAKDLKEFLRKSQQMENSLDNDLKQWKTQKDQFDAQNKTEEERQETINNYVNEFKYLVEKGKLPEIDAKYLDVSWDDPEVAKQPGVKEQKVLLNYMVRENKVRAKAGVQPITSVVDAYNAWKEDTTVQKQEEDKKAAGEARKAAGARVAGVSASNQAPYVPKGIAVGNPNVFRRNQAIWDN